MKKQKSTAFKSVKMLVIAAMLTAMSVVIGIICKTLLNFGNGLMRVTFENLPIIIAGILYGPIIGALVGIASDLVSYLLSPQVLPPNLIVTAGAMTVGLVSGMIAKFIIKGKGTKQIIFSAAAAHIIGSMIIKPIGLYQFYQWGVLLRIPLYFIIAPLEIFVICLLFKNKTFCRVTEYM